MSETIAVESLSRRAFSPFGFVIQAEGVEGQPINGGRCARFHALAAVDALGEGARVIISLFRTEPVDRPVRIAEMERHPFGSQAFYPLADVGWLAIVAPDEGGRPGRPRAFRCDGRQGVCFAANVWHHPLLALGRRSDFLVVDRDGPGCNLETSAYGEPFAVLLEER